MATKPAPTTKVESPTTNSPANPPDALTASARSASFQIALQISTRALTFILNNILLRHLSPSLLALSTQLDLYCTSVLYFSRESLRVALNRRTTGGVQAGVNCAYLALAAGLPVAAGLGWGYLSAFSGSGDVDGKGLYLKEGLWMYALAAILELGAEPAFTAVGLVMAYRVRAAAEASAAVAKTVVTVGCVFAARGEVGVLPFAAGQVAYAFVLLAVYSFGMVRSEGFSLLPERMPNNKNDYMLSYFSRPLLKLTTSLTIQSSVKYILTQGDSIITASLATLTDQGAYALSSNYGSLIARTLFQPIEEASRNLFARLCSPSSPSIPTSASATKETQQNLETASKQAHQNLEKQNLTQAKSILLTTLRLYTLIALPALTLGPTLAPVFLPFLAGQKWTHTPAPAVLGAYVYYVPLLALNGVSEAFVSAVASERELYRQSVWMGVFFSIFAGSAWVFLRVLELGGRGVVGANCVHMLCRAGWNVVFVRGWFGEREIDFEIVDLLPKAQSIGIAAVAVAVVRASSGVGAEYGLLGEIARVGSIGVAEVAAIAVIEREFIMHCVGLAKRS